MYLPHWGELVGIGRTTWIMSRPINLLIKNQSGTWGIYSISRWVFSKRHIISDYLNSFCRTDLKFCSCSDDTTVKVWDFARCQEERSLSGNVLRILSRMRIRLFPLVWVDFLLPEQISDSKMCYYVGCHLLLEFCDGTSTRMFSVHLNKYSASKALLWPFGNFLICRLVVLCAIIFYISNN